MLELREQQLGRGVGEALWLRQIGEAVAVRNCPLSESHLKQKTHKLKLCQVLSGHGLKEIEVVLLSRRTKAGMNEISLRTVRPQGALYKNYCLSFLIWRALSERPCSFYRLSPIVNVNKIGSYWVPG